MEGKANLAGVVRNHEGTGLLAWLNRIGACTSELAEALAMSRGSFPNIFNFPFSLFKKFKIKRKFAYWLPLEFLLMRKQLMHILREKMFNIVIMHILKEKMCRIGRLIC
jgi:hypothetical protein